MERQASPHGEGASIDALDLQLARLFLPLDGEVLTADPTPENLQWLQAHLGGTPVRVVSHAELMTRIRARHGAALLDQAIFGLARRFPELSAQTVITPAQTLVFAILLAAGLAALALEPRHTVRILITALSLAFALSSVFRVFLALMASYRRTGSAGTPNTGALPSYSVLVPLYREARVVPGLVQGLAALDYPHPLLDIKLVVEEDDCETITAATRALEESEVPFEILLVPPGGPRTKPKAANYALAFARGDYLVVYDAEDRPDPDQLKKAVATFRSCSRTTACLQARLTIYNADTNWLTRVLA